MHTSLVLAYFANIADCEQGGIIAKQSQLQVGKCLFSSNVFIVIAVIIAKVPFEYLTNRQYQFNSSIISVHFASQMTWNHREKFAETRSHIFT